MRYVKYTNTNICMYVVCVVIRYTNICMYVVCVVIRITPTYACTFVL